MNFSVFKSPKLIIRITIIIISYALLQSFVLYWLVQLPLWFLLVDGLYHAVIFCGLCTLVWQVLKYGNFEALTFYQRFVNHFALAFMCISLWLTISYLSFSYLFFVEYSNQLVTILPLRGFIGLLIYLLLVQIFRVSESVKNENEPLQTNNTSEDAIVDKAPIKQEIIERVAVKSGTKIHVILVSEICFLQADGDYVQIYTSTGKHLKEQTMKYFEEHLPDNQFVRVHRSTIVNVEMISRIELYEKQNQLLVLKNGQQIKTSPAGYTSLRAALNL